MCKFYTDYLLLYIARDYSLYLPKIALLQPRYTFVCNNAVDFLIPL